MRDRQNEQDCIDLVLRNLDENIYYACSSDDKALIKTSFRSAKRGSDKNKFPDFICDNGFIEHFEVTSSRSNRKGSKMKQETDQFHKNNESHMWYSQHSYEQFCTSLKKIWNRHFNNFQIYKGNKKIGIFLIEYNDSALVTDVVYPNTKHELLYGDLLDRQVSKIYRLTRDAQILEFIYNFKKDIRYVAFINKDAFNGRLCELIAVDNIPEILKIIKEKYSFHCKQIGVGKFERMDI